MELHAFVLENACCVVPADVQVAAHHPRLGLFFCRCSLPHRELFQGHRHCCYEMCVPLMARRHHVYIDRPSHKSVLSSTRSPGSSSPALPPVEITGSFNSGVGKRSAIEPCILLRPVCPNWAGFLASLETMPVVEAVHRGAPCYFKSTEDHRTGPVKLHTVDKHKPEASLSNAHTSESQPYGVLQHH